MEAFRDFRADADQGPHRTADTAAQVDGLDDMVQDVGFARTDDRADPRPFDAVDDVQAGQQVRRRNGDRPDLMQGQHADPPFVPAFEHQHDHIAFPDAEEAEIGCGPVREPFEVGKGILGAASFIVGPHKGGFVRLFRGPDIHYVIGEIEIAGDLEPEILPEILQRRKLRLFQEPFYHNTSVC